jgi:hypothetical protein
MGQGVSLLCETGGTVHHSGTGLWEKFEILAKFVLVHCDSADMYNNILSHAFSQKMLPFWSKCHLYVLGAIKCEHCSMLLLPRRLRAGFTFQLLWAAKEAVLPSRQCCQSRTSRLVFSACTICYVLYLWFTLSAGA